MPVSLHSGKAQQRPIKHYYNQLCTIVNILEHYKVLIQEDKATITVTKNGLQVLDKDRLNDSKKTIGHYYASSFVQWNFKAQFGSLWDNHEN